MKKNIFLVLLAFAIFQAQANEILQASASAPTQEQAKQQALQELSHYINVQVKSYQELTQTAQNSEFFSKITLESESEFINPKITYKNLGKNKIQATATIDNPDDYKKACERATKQINALGIGIDERVTQRDLKDRIYKLENILKIYKQHDFYALILNLMGQSCSAPTQSFGFYASKYESLDPNMFDKVQVTESKNAKHADFDPHKKYKHIYGYKTPSSLISAVKDKSANGVYTALENGANPNLMDEFGTPMLVLAIENFEITQLLLHYGADPEIPSNEGLTPLLAYKKNPALTLNQVCKSLLMLVDYGADTNHTLTYKEYHLHPLTEMYSLMLMENKGKFWEDQGQYYCSKMDMLKAYLDAGADVNAKGHRYNILELVALDNNMELVTFLLNRGAKVDKNMLNATRRDSTGQTIRALMEASID